MSTNLGDRLRRFREEKELSQAALAEAAGVSKPYLSELERDPGKEPSGKILLRLADALGVTIADLLGRSPASVTAPDPVVSESLRTFADGLKLPEPDVMMLASIRFRGAQPTSYDGWFRIYDAIKHSAQESRRI